MARNIKTGSLRRSLPGRQWFHRASILMLVTFGLVLFVMDKSNHPAAMKLRATVMDAATPVLSVMARPFDAVAGVRNWFVEIVDMRAENVALKSQNAQLLQWQSAAKQMEAENRALKGLLGMMQTQSSTYVTAGIVSDFSGPYVHSAILGSGANHGIKADQAVIGKGGLVGRVINVGDKSARVLLLGDINSRVPVMVERTREKSILTGSNDALLSLSYVAANHKIEAGDRVVTSGDGGVFPAGIPVGIVETVEQGSVKVKPFVDPAGIEYVSVVSLN
jgi:rod shape-determining protein MreC